MAQIVRISLRRLLLLMAAAAILLGWYSQSVRRQMRAAEYLRDHGADIYYEDDNLDGFEPPPSRFRSWITETLGRDFAFGVTGVHCGDVILSDNDFAMLSAFPRLKHLFLQHRTATDASLKTIGGLKRLESAQFDRCAITDDGLASLAGLRNLRILSLDGTQVRGPGLAHLNGCTELETLVLCSSKLVPEAFGRIATFSQLRQLWLYATGATDDDVCRLQALSRLEFLNISDNPITDRSIEYVLHFPQLKSFSAESTSLSSGALVRLKRLRPNLTVYTHPKAP